MRRLALVLLLPVLAAPSAAQAFSAPASAPLGCLKTVGVTVGDKGSRLFFSKEKVTIGKRACVRWTWTGVLEHRVVTPDGLRSSLASAPFEFRRRFSQPRVEPYRIYCAVHPRTMKMTVRVKNKRAGSGSRL